MDDLSGKKAVLEAAEKVPKILKGIKMQAKFGSDDPAMFLRHELPRARRHLPRRFLDDVPRRPHRAERTFL